MLTPCKLQNLVAVCYTMWAYVQRPKKRWAPTPLRWRTWLTPETQCVTNIKFGHTRSNSMGVCRGFKKFWGHWGPAPEDGVWMIPHKYAPPPPVTLPNLVILSYTISITMEICQKNLTLAPQCSKSPKVNGTNTDRSATMTSY